MGADAEDIAQETLVAALRAGSRIRNSGAFRPYLLGIARNHARMRRRADERRRRRHEALAGPGEFDPFREASGPADGGPILLAALERLPVASQRAVALFYFEGASVLEISVRLGVTPSSVTTRLSRARRALRKHLGTCGASQTHFASVRDWARSMRSATATAMSEGVRRRA